MSEREPFAALVELGSALGELGAALAEAQWRIDRATLDLATEAAEALRAVLATEAGLSEEEAARRAASFLRERLVFYAIPRVDLRLDSAVRLTRSRSGAIRMLLGGSTSRAEETAGQVEVSLVAVPVGEGLEERLRLRAQAQQQALLEYLRVRGLFGPKRAEALARYGLRGDPPVDLPPTGRWNDPEWAANLRAFRRVWNSVQRESPGERDALLPEGSVPDRRTLAVLGRLADGEDAAT